MDDNSPIVCYRHIDGNPIKLRCDSSQTARKVKASTIEQILTRRLVVDRDVDDVVFSIRADSHWLQCRKPVRAPPNPDHSSPYDLYATLLGIAEDEGNEDLYVAIEHFSPSFRDDDEMAKITESSCGPPHHDWKRRPLDERTPAVHGVAGGDNQDLSLAWIDLRRGPSPVVETQGGTLHFLRSVLTSTHTASPWRNNSEIMESRRHDVVVVVLPEPLPVLGEFRTSDAAPSWFMHSAINCEDLEEDVGQSFWLNGSGTRDDRAKTTPATLYVYKKLPGRHLLSAKTPPPTGVDPTLLGKFTDGVLWETVPPPLDKGIGRDDDINKEKGPKEQEPTYRLLCPPYLNLAEEYPASFQASLFSSQALQDFTEEALRIPRWTPWPETQHYSASSNDDVDDDFHAWTVFPLCYCFPANQPGNLSWVPATSAFCPKTCQRLRETLGPYLRTALFSQLAPHCVLEAHTGWADLANHVLRLHIPLVVPSSLNSGIENSNSSNSNSNDGLCGTWVDGCVETHVHGRPLLFDDSKIHRAFNYSSKTRIVLIVDLARPDHLPTGYATGGHSDELDAFIQKMSMPG